MKGCRHFRLFIPGILLTLILVQGASSQQIPALTATSLDGTVVHLPQAGKLIVLVVGFSRESSDEAAVWGKKLSNAAWNGRSAESYQLAMIGGVPRLLRGVVLKALRKSVPPATQSRFIPVQEDDKPWRKAAQVTSDASVYLLLVDGGGQIRWRGMGAYSDELLRQISVEIESR